jgi:hypothetical protein
MKPFFGKKLMCLQRIKIWRRRLFGYKVCVERIFLHPSKVASLKGILHSDLFIWLQFVEHCAQIISLLLQINYKFPLFSQ